MEIIDTGFRMLTTALIVYFFCKFAFGKSKKEKEAEAEEMKKIRLKNKQLQEERAEKEKKQKKIRNSDEYKESMRYALELRKLQQQKEEQKDQLYYTLKEKTCRTKLEEKILIAFNEVDRLSDIVSYGMSSNEESFENQYMLERGQGNRGKHNAELSYARVINKLDNLIDKWEINQDKLAD